MTPPAAGRIRRRSTFRALRRPEGRAARGPIRAAFVAPAAAGTGPYSLVDGGERVEVAYAVGRRCGNAVHRNRLRRQLRAAARAAAPGLPAGAYLLVPDPPAAELAHQALVAAVTGAMAGAARRGGAR